MKSNTIVRWTALLVLLGSLPAGVAQARNPNCSGGIQYVTMALRDKDKGNMEDYTREINKAVERLSMCANEDPKDYEAIGYLGWAYAEVDSMGPAGKAFETAIQGAKAKGDVKKEEWIRNNRLSFWAKAFNEGVTKIQAGQQAYPDFCKKAEGDQAALKAEAEKQYAAAATSLTQAMLLMPSDARAYRNLATVHALRCEFPVAETILKRGLELAPADSSLQDAMRMVKANMANQLVESKDYDKAIAHYSEAVKTAPNDVDNWSALANVHFSRAQGSENSEARKKDFVASGDAYAKAFELKNTDADFAFNAGVAYQNAQIWDKAEAMWGKTVKLRADDTDALSSWGATLVELKRCPEAVQAVHKAVELKPQDKILHRQLGAIYTKCGNNPRGTDELMVYLAMHNGKTVADAGAQAKNAKQGSDAAKTLASDGVPDAIYQWTADNQQFETWFYWGKKRAFAFSNGTLSRKSDWSTADTKTAAGTGK